MSQMNSHPAWFIPCGQNPAYRPSVLILPVFKHCALIMPFSTCTFIPLTLYLWSLTTRLEVSLIVGRAFSLPDRFPQNEKRPCWHKTGWHKNRDSTSFQSSPTKAITYCLVGGVCVLLGLVNSPPFFPLIHSTLHSCSVSRTIISLPLNINDGSIGATVAEQNRCPNSNKRYHPTPNRKLIIKLNNLNIIAKAFCHKQLKLRLFSILHHVKPLTTIKSHGIP